MPTPASAARAVSAVVSHAGDRQPGVETARRAGPRDALRHGALEGGEQPLALPPVEGPRLHQLLVDPAAPDVLLQHPLAERARALVGVLLAGNELRDDLRGPGCPAEPDTRQKSLGGRPCLHDHVRSERPQARQRFVAEGQLAVRNVLDDEEAVAARELDERLAALGREGNAGGILVVGDRVEQLRPQAVRQTPLELVHLEPVLVHRHGHDLGLEPPEGHDRAEIRRPLDDHRVTTVEERLADQLERFDPPARDQQLVVGGPPVLDGIETSGDGVERARQPLRRRVLECRRLAALGELGEQCRRPAAGERERVGEAAGERDQVGPAQESEHEGDALTDVAARPVREERVPASRLGRDRHGPTLAAGTTWSPPR